MKQILILATVFFCILVRGEGKPNATLNQEQTSNVLNPLLAVGGVGGIGGGIPSMVVEIDDVSNEAAIKIVNLPLMRKNSQSQSQNMMDTRHTIPYNYENIAKSRQTRDLDFKIYDPAIIKKVIEMLNRSDPGRASIMQMNINRIVLEVDFEDAEDYAKRMNYMQLAKQFNFGYNRRRRSITKEQEEKEQNEKSEKSEKKETKSKNDKEQEQEQEKEKEQEKETKTMKNQKQIKDEKKDEERKETKDTKESKNKKEQELEEAESAQVNVQTTVQHEVQPIVPLPNEEALLPPYATSLDNRNCDQLCAKFDLDPVCATNGYCMQEFASRCSLDTYICKNPQSRLHLLKVGPCVHKQMPHCSEYERLYQ